MILLSGGLGYISSNTAVELLNDGYEVVIVDNLSNSSRDVLDKIRTICPNKEIIFYEIDITNKHDLDNVFKNHNIDTVIHFAGYKAVGESVSNPLKYYYNNVTGLIILLETMLSNNVYNIIFSSSATVYGNPKSLPLTEDSEINILNPYGQTKIMCEQIIKDVSKSNDNFKAVILRYFNPVGAHSSGLIGENPIGIPNNLFPYILDVVIGKRDKLFIFGNDYNTPDGTPIRDFIHVTCLSKGHFKALQHINNIQGYGLDSQNRIKIYNLGTGKGYSVLDIVNTFNKHLSENGNEEIKYEYAPRRDGDSEEIYADCSLAKKELGWSAELGLDDMIKDSLNFISKSL